MENISECLVLKFKMTLGKKIERGYVKDAFKKRVAKVCMIQIPATQLAPVSSIDGSA